MKPIKRASCPVCKLQVDTQDVKTDKQGISLKLKCTKDGTPLKLSSQWYVRTSIDGRNKYVPCGLLKRDAEDYIASIRVAKRTGSILPGQEKVVTWEDGLAEFEKAEMRDSTRNFYKSMLAGMTKEFSGINLADLTPDRLTDYAQERKTQGCSARTIAGYIGSVKRLFTLVTRYMNAKQYPRLHETMLDIHKIEKPTVDNYKSGFFSADEVKAMIAAAPERLALAIRLQIETGLRPGNVYSLKLSDISEDGTITLAGDVMKNGKEFITSISRGLLHSIKLYAMKTGTRDFLFPTDSKSGHAIEMRASWKAMCKAAGVTGTPHKLRHSFASIMLAQDVPLVVVSELLAHSDIGVTKKRYGHLEHAKKRDVLAEYRDRLAL